MVERLGKFCFSKKRPYFFYLTLFFPLFLASFYSFIQYQKMTYFEELFSSTCKKGKPAIVRKQKKEKFIQRYKNPNPFFLNEYIESISFLNSEVDELKKTILHPAVADKKTLEQRLDFLTKGANRLSFIEEAIRSNHSMKEIEEKQRYPVQMNGDDIKKLLSIIEDTNIENERIIVQNRPQIIITDFKIESKQTSIKTNVFEVEMQFIKREFE